MPEVKPSEVESTASIKVIGVGGAGGSAHRGNGGLDAPPGNYLRRATVCA